MHNCVVDIGLANEAAFLLAHNSRPKLQTHAEATPLSIAGLRLTVLSGASSETAGP